MGNYGNFKVIAVYSRKKEHILGIYSTFEKANAEVENIFKAIESGKTVYKMSEGENDV